MGIKKICYLLGISLLLSCSSRDETKNASSNNFVKGADISWLPQMEASNYQFYDDNGNTANCLDILKQKGITTARLRVFVNPSSDRINGHCSKDETVAFAQRLKNAGFRILIDFHYSDSWADPSKQFKPQAWANDSFSQLLQDVYNHTYDVLSALKTAGVTPEWVQVGNEISGGMLWPTGQTPNWNQLAQLINKGYDAVKAVDSSIKVIVHLDEGNNKAKFTYFFDNIAAYNARYDVIGMSYYPYWGNTNYTQTIANLQDSMNTVVQRYNKEVMVVEVGGDVDQPDDTRALLQATMNAVKSVPNNKGLGVLYWEPEGAKSWSGYQLSCWLSNGRPSPALNALNN